MSDSDKNGDNHSCSPEDEDGLVEVVGTEHPNCCHERTSPRNVTEPFCSTGDPTVTFYQGLVLNNKKKLILHIDLNNTILVSDAVTGQGTIAALDYFLTTVTWGKMSKQGTVDKLLLCSTRFSVHIPDCAGCNDQNVLLVRMKTESSLYRGLPKLPVDLTARARHSNILLALARWLCGWEHMSLSCHYMFVWLHHYISVVSLSQ